MPKTYLARNFYIALPTEEKEPIGQRIVEVPKDVERHELCDARVPLIAYVPPGSVSKGEALARTGNGGKTIACGTCHGSDLKGLGTIPPIAGQSPSYIVRQLYDFQQGTRAGSMSALMKPAVEKLALDDMISLASYLASLEALNRAGGPEFGFGVASRRSAEQNDRSVCDTGADHDRKSNDSTTARSVEHG